MSDIKIEVLYSEIANLFGDLMNIKYLEKCIPDAKIIYTGLNDVPSFTKEDISLIYLGPMTEHQQELVISKLMPYTDRIKECIDNDVIFLLTGNALEVFGEYIQNEDGSKIQGLGIFNTYAKRDMMHRYNSLLLGRFEDMTIIGFKAQFSHSYGYNSDCYFYEVTRGDGLHPGTNNEGLRRRNFFATYSVGPFLIMNPLFVEYLLRLLGINEPKLAFHDEIMEAYRKRLAEFENPALRY